MKKVIWLLALFPVLAFAAGVTPPPVVVEGFGVNAGGSYITNPLPVASQIGIANCRASYNDGFPPLSMMPTGCNPFGQDINGVLFAATQNTAAWIGGQYWPYNSTFVTANGGYAQFAIVAMAAGNGFWLNLLGGNTTNPDTSTPGASTGWVPLVGYTTIGIAALTSGAVTLTAAQAAGPVLFLSGTLTGNVQVILPTWSKSWIIINGTSGNFTVTAKTASGSGVIIPQTGSAAPAQVYCDGSNIQPLSTINQTLSAHKGSTTSRANTSPPILTNDPDLLLAVPAAGTYQISGALFFSQATSGAGIEAALTFTGTSSAGLVHLSGYVNGAALAGSAVPSAGTTVINVATVDTTGTNDVAELNGTLVATSAGLYSVAWAQHTTNANATSMLAGSYLKLSPIN